ncbi:uridylate kinase [Friedmanniella endophytica]|uniref:Uridylate kinase n=2 Tax=Microlunatus kandeliicorticis TaxID=1759536 RepID=A0A7W3IRK3_9ACTN|nr:uridylate kinase [Microlunatus kandeliicorticis]
MFDGQQSVNLDPETEFLFRFAHCGLVRGFALLHQSARKDQPLSEPVEGLDHEDPITWIANDDAGSDQVAWVRHGAVLPAAPRSITGAAVLVDDLVRMKESLVSRYQRVVLKLSGEALAGSSGWGVEPDRLAHLSEEVLAVHDLGIQVAVVVGGGNYFRGRMAEGWGIGRAEADNIGMLGTVMNALMLRGALTGRTGADVRVMTAVPIQSVAEPFIRLRAISHLEQGRIVILAGGIGQPYVTTDYPSVQRALELDADALLVAKRDIDAVYDKDPNLHDDAVRFDRLTYQEAVARGIKVMDTSAFVLAGEQGLTMHIFDVAQQQLMRRICLGENIGTLITASD